MTVSEFIQNKNVTAIGVALDYNIVTELFIDDISHNISTETTNLPTLFAYKKTTNFTINNNILSVNGFNLDLTTVNMIGVKWHYSTYPKRIVAPNTLVLDDLGAKLFNWLKLNKLPIITLGNFSYVYINQILPEHETMVSTLASLITIENKP